MLRVFLILAGVLQLGVACVPTPLPVVMVEPTARDVSFLNDVKPVLDRRCVVCHSCYNAACQLKLSSFEGIDRGGSKSAVYDSSRLHAQDPSRLFMDADSTDAWRALDFQSVTESDAASPANDSILLYLLEAKKRFPKSTGEYRAEAADLSCPADSGELTSFLSEHPERGMPFGFPELSPGEHSVLATWLDRGAPGPSAKEQTALTTPSATDAVEIAKWEEFLNQDDPKHAMTARYLYEHLFLSHLHFSDTGSGAFYEVVRSTRPPGQPISVIATVRPYDDPGVDRFFYRLRKIHSTIVHKTHMVVALDDEVLARYRELFIDTEWLEPPHRVRFGEVDDANPFVVYEQIPPGVRYQFLLDHSEYMIRTFIRGPVCKGQVALNVINDHFWVMFMDPESDLGVVHPGFLAEQAPNLRMPAEAGSDEGLVGALEDDGQARERYADFMRAKIKFYDQIQPEGVDLDAIWRGRVDGDAPLLTVYRHFDSASVHKGALGELPRTLWVIDYSQFERIYYSLVAGFDVFGNLFHQVSTRRYMDYLRMEGEINFMYFLPPDAREPLLRSWYVGDGAIEDMKGLDLLTHRPSRIGFSTEDPKRELVERVVDDHLLESIGIEFDPLNYRRTAAETPMPSTFETHADILNGLRALTAPGTAFIRHMNISEANVLWLRVRGFEGSDRFISIVINRWHDNVNSLFFEKNRLDASKDTIEFHEGPIGSYPNFFFDVAAEDVPDFFDMLENFDGSPEYLAKATRYGVNRAEEDFWDLYDWFQAEANQFNQIEAGIYDLNRYYSHAID
jgi:hypothetical protein